MNMLSALLGIGAYIAPHGPGTTDSDLDFCTAQSIPTDGADDISENDIDLQVTNPFLTGAAMEVQVEVTTSITVASGTTSILDLVLCSAATASATVGAVTEHAIIGQLEYDSDTSAMPAAGRIFRFGVPSIPVEDYLRYLSLKLQPRSDDTLFSAGAIDATLKPVR